MTSIMTPASLRGLLVCSLLGLAAVTGCWGWRAHVQAEARAAAAARADELAWADRREAVAQAARMYAALVAEIDRLAFVLAMVDRSTDVARGQGGCHYRSDAERRADRERLAELRREREVLLRSSPDWGAFLATPGLYEEAMFDDPSTSPGEHQRRAIERRDRRRAHGPRPLAPFCTDRIVCDAWR